MDTKTNQRLIESAGTWFKETIVANHIENTKKLEDFKAFKINPFLAPYLSVFLTGDLDADGIARILVLPRALQTSITTSFGTNMQFFISDVLADTYGSVIQGLDIEYIDQIDGRTKYAQVKLGPNTINADDVKTIHDHFSSTRRLAATNRRDISLSDMVVGVLYGADSQLSAHYRKLSEEHNYTVSVGKDFWVRLTGDDEFFDKLIGEFVEQSKKLKPNKLVEEVIEELANSDEIQNLVAQLKTS